MFEKGHLQSKNMASLNCTQTVVSKHKSTSISLQGELRSRIWIP